MWNDPIKLNQSINRLIWNDSIFSNGKIEILKEIYEFPRLSPIEIIENQHPEYADVIRVFTDLEIESCQEEYEYIDITEQLRKEINLNESRSY